MAKIKVAKLSDFKFDPENANKGTPRGKELLKKSLKQERAGRSIVSAADGTILCGNKTLAAAQEVGFKNAKVVESTGEDLIIHVRTDIPNSKTKEARRIALGDNRIGELSYNPDDEILGSFAKFDESILENFWDENEIRSKFEGIGIFSGIEEKDTPILKDGDRAPFQQMTFTLHDEQVEEVRGALVKAKNTGGVDSLINENSNGNALAWICHRFNRE